MSQNKHKTFQIQLSHISISFPTIYLILVFNYMKDELIVSVAVHSALTGPVIERHMGGSF